MRNGFYDMIKAGEGITRVSTVNDLTFELLSRSMFVLRVMHRHLGIDGRTLFIKYYNRPTISTHDHAHLYM